MIRVKVNRSPTCPKSGTLRLSTCVNASSRISSTKPCWHVAGIRPGTGRTTFAWSIANGCSGSDSAPGMSCTAARPTSMRRWQTILKRAIAEQEVDDIALVRLQPVQSTRRNRTDIQTINMPSINKVRDPLVVVRDGCAHER